ncbi:MAG: hypothetical protein LBQ31_08345 [Bacteroidales bacterium]|jgi:hypothetical protein|nr:hypothetical protein [Bacteroidales bacterium]
MDKKPILFCVSSIVFCFCAEIFAVNPGHKSYNVCYQKGIKDLIEKNKEYNSSQKLAGFKILIFSQTGNGSKNNAFSAKSSFSEIFPSIPAYLVYEEPHFKVKVGNFRMRRDAAQFLRTIQDVYPNAFVVQDFLDIDDYFSK